MTLQATPTKLRSGEWGARVKGSATEGDTVQITTKSGKSWTATVRKVVWQGMSYGHDVAIVATSSSKHSSTRRTRRSSCPTGGDCDSFGIHCRECGTEFFV